MTTADWIRTIEKDGYIEVPDFIGAGQLTALGPAIDRGFDRPMINGQMGYVKVHNYRYLFQSLSWHPEIVNIYTDPRLLELVEVYGGSPVHLSNFRIYRSYPDRSARMAWHVDNKEDHWDEASNRFVTKMRKDDRGLILIAYLSDVELGGLQIVRGSHLWTAQSEREQWDTAVGAHQQDIVTFNNRKAGTAIIYDYRCIHRAEPYFGGRHRTSLFGQYSPSHMPAGEPILLPTAFLAKLTEQQKYALNFGVPPTTLNWPIGNPAELMVGASTPRALALLIGSRLKRWLRALLP
ncbi:MAG TPA: phytanoyl-CoA dioxygenase family protein [Fontimonas sp.]